MGKHFLNQLSLLTKTLPNLSLILISRSNKSLSASLQNPISFQTWEQDLTASTAPALNPQEIIRFFKSTPGKYILVDNTSDQDIADNYPEFLRNEINIVTPNKKAFSSTLSLWRTIQNESYSPYAPYLSRGLIYHESSVGAGLPIISTLKDLVSTGDEVQRIEGVFSGTMSFLFNQFAPVEEKGGKWSEEVRKAKEMGFTEPDPRDDLNGVDVARKLVILARLVGLEVEGTDSFPVQSLIPKELEGVESGEAFMERLAEFDGWLEEVKDEASRKGKVVRFVGSVDVGENVVKVGLEKFDKSHPIAGLKGSDNIVSFYTKRYGSNPLVVQGAGWVLFLPIINFRLMINSAGGAVTAMGVTADLIKVIQRIS